MQHEGLGVSYANLVNLIKNQHKSSYTINGHFVIQIFHTGKSLLFKFEFSKTVTFPVKLFFFPISLISIKHKLTVSFFSITSIRNSGSSIVFFSDIVIPFKLNRYSPRRTGVCRVLYALFTKELHSELKLCSASLFVENLSGCICDCTFRNRFVSSFKLTLGSFWMPNKSK